MCPLAAASEGYGVPLATPISGLARFSGVRCRVDLAAEAREGDTVALLSNGAFAGIYDKLRAALEG